MPLREDHTALFWWIVSIGAFGALALFLCIRPTESAVGGGHRRYELVCDGSPRTVWADDFYSTVDRYWPQENRHTYCHVFHSNGWSYATVAHLCGCDADVMQKGER